MNEFFGSPRRLRQTILMAAITATLAFTIASTVGVFLSNSTLLTIILGMLTFILIATLTGQLQLERQIETLSQHVVQGDPNTVLKSTDLNSAFVDLASERLVDLMIVAYDLVGLLATESHVLIQALNMGARIRIILPNPADTGLLQRVPMMAKSGSDLKTLQQDIEYSLAQLKKIQVVTAAYTRNVEIRYSDTPFMVTGMLANTGQSNGVLLITIPVAGSHRASSYVYFTLRHHTSTELFNLFSTTFETMWTTSRAYEG